MEQDFYLWLSDQFNDLQSCKIFYKKWSVDQNCPFGSFSMRSMAAHCSNVLEGKKRNPNAITTNYINTRYGSEIFLS